MFKTTVCMIKLTFFPLRVSRDSVHVEANAGGSDMIRDNKGVCWLLNFPIQRIINDLPVL